MFRNREVLVATPAEIERIQKYYEVNLNHAKWSFWASLASVGVGMVVLLAGVAMLFTKEVPDASIVATADGVISELSLQHSFIFTTKI